jgi:hypothetical protein
MLEALALVAVASATPPPLFSLHVSCQDGGLQSALDRVAGRESTAIPARLLLDPGIHHITKPLRLGRAHSNLTILSADLSAVVSGGLRIDPSAWHPVPGTPLVAAALEHELPLGVVPKQLFTADGTRRATRARHPNLYAADGATVMERPYLYWAAPLCDFRTNATSACESAARLGFVFNATDDLLFRHLTGNSSGTAAVLEAVVYHGWTASRHMALPGEAAIDPRARTLRFTNPSDRPIGYWMGRSSEGGQRYYLENARELLDSPGEWFLDPSSRTLYYYPLPGETHQHGAAYLPLVDEILTISGASHVTIDGVGFRHADWTCGGEGGTASCDGQSVEWQDHAALHVTNASSINIENCDVSCVGPSAIWVDTGSADVSIERCGMHTLGTGAVRIGSPTDRSNFHPGRPAGQPVPTGVRLRNSNLTDGSDVFVGGTAVLVQFAQNVTIEHNEISRFSYTGISLGWSWNYLPQVGGGHKVDSNYIHHLGYPRRETGDAMACVYTLGELGGTRGEPTIVSGNVCHDVRAYMSGGYCLSQDQGSSSLLFEKNVCLRTTGTPHNTHYGANITYTNNLFFDGYHDCWVPPGADGAAAALRTSPDRHGACKPYVGGSCPDQIRFSRNLIGLVSNNSALLFEGDWNGTAWNDTAPPSNASVAFGFESNVYWSEVGSRVDLLRDRVFGGVSLRVVPHSPQRVFHLSWDEWRAAGHDRAGAVVRGDPGFADPGWANPPFNVSLTASSPAMAVGWEQIDTSRVGIQPR